MNDYSRPGASWKQRVLSEACLALAQRAKSLSLGTTYVRASALSTQLLQMPGRDEAERAIERRACSRLGLEVCSQLARLSSSCTAVHESVTLGLALRLLSMDDHLETDYDVVASWLEQLSQPRGEA